MRRSLRQVRLRIPRRIPHDHVTIRRWGGRTPDTLPAARLPLLEVQPVPYAVIFPGQGAAAPGAGRAWVDHRAWDVVAEAEAVLDRPLARLLLDADGQELSATGASQLAVLLSSLVAW